MSRTTTKHRSSQRILVSLDDQRHGDVLDAYRGFSDEEHARLWLIEMARAGIMYEDIALAKHLARGGGKTTDTSARGPGRPRRRRSTHVHLHLNVNADGTVLERWHSTPRRRRTSYFVAFVRMGIELSEAKKSDCHLNTIRQFNERIRSEGVENITMDSNSDEEKARRALLSLDSSLSEI